jgi:NNP family nitrate/nitrite transporter-like MFS transporter
LAQWAVQIANDLQLTRHSNAGLMVATPILAGAILRFVMGILVDKHLAQNCRLLSAR